MFRNYFTTPIKIIENRLTRSGGIEKEESILVSEEYGRLNTPKYQDFRIIQNITDINQETWVLYLDYNSKITSSSRVQIQGIEYKVLGVYPVRTKRKVHHIKSFITKI